MTLPHSDDTASNFREVGPDILSAQTEELRERADSILISKNKTDISHIKLRASKEPTILDDGKGTLTPERRPSAVDFHTGLCYTVSNITSTTVLMTTLLVAVLIGRGGRQAARVNRVYERSLVRVPLSGSRSSPQAGSRCTCGGLVR